MKFLRQKCSLKIDRNTNKNKFKMCVLGCVCAHNGQTNVTWVTNPIY